MNTEQKISSKEKVVDSFSTSLFFIQCSIFDIQIKL